MSLRIKLIQFLIDLNEKLIFYPRLKAHYKSLVNGSSPLIIDVGANKGQSIVFFLKNYPKATIYAFEPNKVLYERLIKTFGHLPNIKLINKGVSNIVGTLTLKETVTDETSTFEELNYDSKYLKLKSQVLGVSPENIVSKSYEVDVTTLKDFFLENNIANVDVLKIDTEGHEFKCLQGLFATNVMFNVQIIQLENHRDDMYLNNDEQERIAPYLNSNGFDLVRTIKHGFGDFDELLFRKRI